MATYLLLRNNKQSGPLSKEQLLQLGLKPYDLVWLEGKSAAWRYPSELPELKDFAPIVEEQPYDRFYKKQTEEPKEQEPEIAQVKNIYESPKEVKETKEIKIGTYEQYMPAKTASLINPTDELKEQESVIATINDTFGKQKETKEVAEVKETKEIPEEKYEQYMPKKAVSVIMPKQAASVKKEEPVYMHIPASAPVVASSATKKSVEAITDTSLEVETKYSQPLDEIKEMYVKQLQQRKHKSAQKKFIIQSLKKAAIFIAIIGSGVLIGFIIKPKHSSKNNIVNSQPQNNIPATIQTSKQETIQPEENKINSAEIKKPQQESSGNKNEVVPNEQKSQSLTVSENTNSIDGKKKVKEEKDESSVNQQSPATVINTPTGERNKNSRIDNGENESNEKSIALIKDISKLVSVKSNNYKIGAFGGVHNLELTITNDSKFTLDNVMVELQYLKLSEQPVKIEHIRFQSVAPNGSLTMRIPDTNRGAKLSYKIIKIDPKDLNTNTAGL
jgi:hypothetical protein